MKVQEIITTAEDLNEGLVSDLFAKGAQYFSKSEAVDKLVAKWTSELASNGKIITKSPAEVIGADLAKDKDLVKSAIAKVRKQAPGIIRKRQTGTIVKGVSKIADNAAGLVTKLTTLGVGALSVKQYMDRMAGWEKDLADGKITQEQYEAARQHEMTLLVAQVAGSLAGWSILKSVTYLPVKIIGRFIPGLQTVVSGLNAYGMYAASEWLRSEPGREFLATALINDYIDLSPILGGVPLNIVDKFKAMIPGFNSKQPSGPAQPQKMGQTPAAAPTGATTPGASASQVGKIEKIPGTALSSKITGPNSFDIDYSTDIK